MSPEMNVLLGVVVGAVIGNLTTVIGYFFGSSQGSRNKDDLIGKVLTAPPASGQIVTAPTLPPVRVPNIILPPVPPVISVPAPLPPTGGGPATYTLTGKMSNFGGPKDTGMAEDEGLALFEPSEAGLIANFLLPVGAPELNGATGLGRRLDPSKLYIAMRWDYKKTPRSFLQNIGVHVTNKAGKTIVVRPVDWGPNANTGRVCDLSPGACTALGLQTDDTVTVTVPLPPGATPTPVPPTAAGEPLWLTYARAEIGFHEQPDNTGIQRYTSLAGFGVEHDPWCAIFAGAMFRKAGVDITGIDAMARSFTTAPSFTKLDAPQLGCVVTFWRGSKTGTEGHVGFWISEDATKIQTLGGNEDDQVEIEGISKANLLGYYWPTSPARGGQPKLD